MDIKCDCVKVFFACFDLQKVFFVFANALLPLIEAGDFADLYAGTKSLF